MQADHQPAPAPISFPLVGVIYVSKGRAARVIAGSASVGPSPGAWWAPADAGRPTQVRVPPRADGSEKRRKWRGGRPPPDAASEYEWRGVPAGPRGGRYHGPRSGLFSEFTGAIGQVRGPPLRPELLGRWSLCGPEFCLCLQPIRPVVSMGASTPEEQGIGPRRDRFRRRPSGHPTCVWVSRFRLPGARAIVGRSNPCLHSDGASSRCGPLPV